MYQWTVGDGVWLRQKQKRSVLKAELKRIINPAYREHINCFHCVANKLTRV